MKRYSSPLLISLVATAALMFGAFACSSDRAVNSGGEGEKTTVEPGSKINLVTVEPDSVRGDTVFYSYTVKGMPNEEWNWVFATFDDRWHIRCNAGPIWEGFYDGPAEGWLVVYTNSLHLRCVSDDDALIERAQETIEQYGNPVEMLVTRDSYGFSGFPIFVISLPERWPSASVPLLDWMAAFEQHSDVFGGVWPTIQATRDDVSGGIRPHVQATHAAGM